MELDHGEQRLSRADGRCTRRSRQPDDVDRCSRHDDQLGFVNEVVVPGISAATTLAFLPDRRMLVGELTETIWVVRPEPVSRTRRRSCNWMEAD